MNKDINLQNFLLNFYLLLPRISRIYFRKKICKKNRKIYPGYPPDTPDIFSKEQGGGDNIYEQFFQKTIPLPGIGGIISTSNSCLVQNPFVRSGNMTLLACVLIRSTWELLCGLRIPIHPSFQMRLIFIYLS